MIDPPVIDPPLVLKPGDVVRLKSGGPRMTVVDFVDETDDFASSVTCVWFHQGGDGTWATATTVDDFDTGIVELAGK